MTLPFKQLVVVLGCLTACMFLIPTFHPSQAAFPGYNGKIVFVTNRDGNYEIYTMNSDASNLTRLTNNSATDQNPAWSKDGSKLAFISNRDGNNEIYTMNADGSNLLRITNNAYNDERPNWSPDGSQFVFSSNSDGNKELYVMNVDGTNQIRMTTNSVDDIRPNWSPDGNKITFTSMRDTNPNGEIYSMNADGSLQTRLTSNGSVNEDRATWKSDNEHIIFHSFRDGNNEIYVMDANGSNPIRLTNNSPSDANAAGSPNGSQIVFQSNRDGNNEIYTMDADGSNSLRLTTNVGSDEQAEWQPIPNLIPIVNAETLNTAYNTAGTRNVLANDTDEESLSGTNLSITVSPEHGTAMVNPTDSTITFTPSTSFVGSDQLTYRICDSFILDQKCANGVLAISVSAGPAPAIPTISKVGTIESNGAAKIYYTGHRPTFTGTAEPSTAIRLEIHPDLIVLTSVTDANGQWSVTPNQDIPNGEHTITITASKNGATSNPLSFALGINIDLADTGVPVWPLCVAGITSIYAIRLFLKKRYV